MTPVPAPLVEMTEQEKLAEDLLLYGKAFACCDKRIDPQDVFIEADKASLSANFSWGGRTWVGSLESGLVCGILSRM